jgi:hypothetical protein
MWSNAFFSTAGTPWLYSGVMMMKASAGRDDLGEIRAFGSVVPGHRQGGAVVEGKWMVPQVDDPRGHVVPSIDFPADPVGDPWCLSAFAGGSEDDGDLQRCHSDTSAVTASATPTA